MDKDFSTSDQSQSGIVGPLTVVVSGSRFTQLHVINHSQVFTIWGAERGGRRWVLKALSHEVAGQSLYQAFLQKEYEILVSAQHPNVVTVLGMEDVPDVGRCIVMEWVDGYRLDEWLRMRLSHKERLRVANQLLCTISDLHGRQIAHRDLKPANVLITRNGNYVKIIDFGLADTDNYTILKQPAGSVGYISPEQATDHKTDVRNDVYSIGQILRQLLPSWQYRWVVYRCLKPLPGRYSSAEAVSRGIRRMQRLPWLVAGFIIFSVISGVVMYNLNSTRQATTELKLQNRQAATTIDSLTIVLGKARSQLDSTRVSLHHTQVYTDSLRRRVSAEDAYQAKKALAFARGKRNIDRMVRSMPQYPFQRSCT